MTPATITVSALTVADGPRREKSWHQLRVEDFMRRAGQSLPALPQPPSEIQAMLRVRLIMEELLETVEAAGLAFLDREQKQIKLQDLVIRKTGEPNLVAYVDGLADLSVVVTGGFSDCGVADVNILEEVDENNLTKFAAGYYIDVTGKLKKPPNHKPPDFIRALKEQGAADGYLRLSPGSAEGA